MVRMNWLRPGLALGLAILLSGCGSTGGSAASRSGTNTLTQAEIEEIGAANLYEVVEKLRPRWLQVRAPTSMTEATAAVIGVYVNRTHHGGVEVLRSMPVTGVTTMRYMDGTQASAVLRSAGGTALAGAIVIERSN